MDGMIIAWAAVFVLSIFIEAETAEMVAIWFMPGAIASLVLSILNVEIWIQAVVFVSVSAILLILAKTIFRRKLMKNVCQEKTDIDLLIGRQVRVEECIDNSAESGAVKINGQIWSARMSDASEVADVGEYVIIDEIQGVKLICRKLGK